MSNSTRVKMAFVTSHPTQYHSPFFRVLARDPGVDLTVCYCRDFGIGKTSLDPGFGTKISWDLPLLEGYRHRFFANLSPRPSSGLAGQFNPGLIRWLLVERPDLVVLHGWMTATNWMAAAACRAAGIPLILKGEGDLRRERGVGKKALRRPALRFLAATAAAGLYSCSANRDYLAGIGIPEDRLFFFPCAVDNDFFRRQAAEPLPEPPLRRELGLDPGTVLVLFSGKLIPRKRPLDLLAAFSRARFRNPAALLFLGDGELRKRIEVAQGGTPAPVVVTGFVNQSGIGRYYREADIFVLPSQWDPSPKAVNEAMNFSLPLILSDGVGTAWDLVSPGANGFVFPAGNVERLRALLEELAGDPDRRKRMGEVSARMVAEWSYENEAAGTMAAAARAREGKR